MHLVGFFGDSASECVGGFDMSAGLTAFAVAWPVSILPGPFSDGREIMLLNDYLGSSAMYLVETSAKSI